MTAKQKTNEAELDQMPAAAIDTETDEPARQYDAVYDLEYPVEGLNDAGEMVIHSQLFMRRPTLLDKVLAEKQTKDKTSYQGTAIMLAAVCGVDESVIYELDEELDIVKLVERFNKFEEEPEIAGENTLVLKYPLTANGKKIEKLTLRRPKARDSLEFGDESLGDKIARLCGYDQKDLYEMDLKTDWLGLEKIYSSFRKRKPKRK